MATRPESESRNWLILSLKWSTGDWLKWYATGCSGYTSSLILAGRYTEAEARANEVEGHTLAVSLVWAIERTSGHVVLRNDGRTLRRLKRLSKARATTGPRTATSQTRPGKPQPTNAIGPNAAEGRCDETD